MNETFLYGVLPCAAVALALGALVYRYRAPLSERVKGFLDRNGRGTGPVALLAGATVVVLCHALGFLMPGQVRILLGTPLRTFVLEVMGLVGGLLLAYGLIWYVARRWAALGSGLAGWAWRVVHLLLVTEVLSGCHVAGALRWGSAWYLYVVVPYLRSVLAFQPDTALMAQLPFAVRLHLLAGVALLVAVPVARWLEAAKPLPIRVPNEETARQAGVTP